MTTEFYIGIALGFFAGLSLGLGLTVVLAVSWLKAVQTRLVGDTVAEIMEELGMPEEDPQAETSTDPDDFQEEWWKTGKK